MCKSCYVCYGLFDYKLYIIRLRVDKHDKNLNVYTWWFLLLAFEYVLKKAHACLLFIALKIVEFTCKHTLLMLTLLGNDSSCVAESTVAEDGKNLRQRKCITNFSIPALSGYCCKFVLFCDTVRRKISTS